MNFDVLGTQRAIRDDDALTSGEKLFLLMATLRTDNNSGVVRASLGLIARDANMHRDSGTKHSRSSAVLTHLRVEEVSPRLKKLSWVAYPKARDTRNEGVSETEGEGIRNRGSRYPKPRALSTSSTSDLPKIKKKAPKKTRDGKDGHGQTLKSKTPHPEASKKKENRSPEESEFFDYLDSLGDNAVTPKRLELRFSDLKGNRDRSIQIVADWRESKK